MSTIYTMVAGHTDPNVIEIFNVYDGRYFYVAVNGEIVHFYAKTDIKALMSRSLEKKLAKQLSAPSERWHFVYYDWETYADLMTPGYYDANDFESYAQFDAFATQHGAGLKRIFDVIGYDALEQKIS